MRTQLLEQTQREQDIYDIFQVPVIGHVNNIPTFKYKLEFQGILHRQNTHVLSMEYSVKILWAIID